MCLHKSQRWALAERHFKQCLNFGLVAQSSKQPNSWSPLKSALECFNQSVLRFSARVEGAQKKGLQSCFKISDLLTKDNKMWSCNKDCIVCDMPMLNQPKKNKFKGQCRSKVTPPELIISKSSICGAGLGVFAAAPIRKGTIVSNYEGQIRKEEDCFQKELSQNRFLWDLTGLCKGFVVDSSDPTKSNFARYINHNKRERRNLIALGHMPKGRPTVSFIATRDLQMREELFVDYGEEYNRVLREEGFLRSTDPGGLMHKFVISGSIIFHACTRVHMNLINLGTRFESWFARFLARPALESKFLYK